MKKPCATKGHATPGRVVQPIAACPLHTFCQQLGVTAREHEVCQWLMQGKTNAEIGGIMRISPRTAEKHVQSVLNKLGVGNRSTAAVELLRRVGQSRF